MYKLREWPCQCNLYCVVIQCQQAGNLNIIVRTFCFPAIQPLNPVLPYPGTLGTGPGVKMPLDGIDKIMGVHFPANCAFKGRVVNEIHTLPDWDGHR